MTEDARGVKLGFGVPNFGFQNDAFLTNAIRQFESGALVVSPKMPFGRETWIWEFQNFRFHPYAFSFFAHQTIYVSGSGVLHEVQTY